MERFDLLKQEFHQLSGVILAESQLSAARRYAELLHTWNQKINLTGITSPEDIRVKHFLDSLSCQLVMEGTPHDKVVDVGTGGGFPGLPLKLLYPEMHLSLVESTAKKTAFLSRVVQELGLNRVVVVTSRAEIVGQQPEHREQYDWALARAVALLPVLVEYLLPLVRIGGHVLAQKGESTEEELASAGDAIELLGGEIKEVRPVELPGVGDKRFLIVIKKTSPTPDKYPRRVGIPAKRPLGR